MNITLYCVYSHLCPITKQVRYVGMGRRYRAYMITRDNKYHREYNNWVKDLLKNNLEPEVIILKNNLSKQEALLLEMEYIKSYKNEPLFNKTNGGEGIKGYKHSNQSKIIMSNKKTKKLSNHSRKVININSGIVFESIKEAASCYGLKHTTLVAQLRGQNKNKTFLRYI